MKEIREIIEKSLKYFDAEAFKTHDPVSEAQIHSAETWLKTRFPASLHEFLLAHNGIEIGNRAVFGIPPAGQRIDIVEATTENRKAGLDGWDDNFMQISAGGLGNPFFIDLSEKREDSFPVCFFVRATGESCVVASNLAHFIWFFIEMQKMRLNPDGTWKKPQPGTLPWPTDEEYVTRHDPWIERWKDRGYPWDLDPNIIHVD